MNTAAEQLRRVLQLIPQLADDEEHPISDVARQLGTDRRALLAELRSLAERAEDAPGFVDGFSVYIEGDVVSVHASHFLRPMRLTRAELLALELGLAMLRAERPPEEQRVIDGARERLRQVLAHLPDEELIQDRNAETAAPVSRELLSLTREAARARTKLRVSYQRADESNPTDRTVCPYALLFASGMWYLVAHCDHSDGLRIFRLDRIRAAEPDDEMFDVPAGFSVAELVREGRVFAAEGAGRLTVRYSPNVARWLAEREGAAVAADGSLTLEHPLADLDWAVRHVLQYGPDAEILEPPEARDAVRRRLDLMARAVATNAADADTDPRD